MLELLFLKIMMVFNILHYKMPVLPENGASFDLLEYRCLEK